MCYLTLAPRRVYKLTTLFPFPINDDTELGN
jgi:hypothetical protein